jgi:UDP-N-acetylglucosamine 2-epimerase (hydrolysing)
MNSKKNIVFITGTRADFGKLKSLIHIVNSLDGFECGLFVTGMHLLKRYGSTFKEIENSGFKNIHKYINQYTNESMDMILANTIHGFSRYISENRPDMIVIHGDRVETLAAAIVGSINNILVVHIEGGERSGTIDDSIRHSVTKLSHIHLVANEEAKARIMKMGEEERRIFIFGSADIDIMKSERLPLIEDVKKHYDISYNDYHIVLFHPVTTEVVNQGIYADILVEALIESRENFVIIYPNNDHGANEILQAYEKLHDNGRFSLYPSVKFEAFLSLIKNAKSIIGNSSAGIREAPIFGIPAINIGTRQKNRFKSESIIDCNYDKRQILEAIWHVSKSTVKYSTCEYFGIGDSTERFKNIIMNKEIWELPPQKFFEDYKEVIY